MSLADFELKPMTVPVEKAHEIVIAGLTMAGVSRQLDLTDEDWTPDDAIQPPLDPDKLAALSENSGTRSAIIDAMARNTVGLGYEVAPADGHEEEFSDPRTTAREAKACLEGAASRDIRLDRPSFTDLLIAVKTDEEEVGTGYLEVSRDRLSGKIDGLFHAPSKFMRRKRDRSGYIMIDRNRFVASDNERVDFYNFGEKADYDDDGNPTGIKDGRGFRNEILSFRIYTSESRDYGLPRDSGLALTYLGDKLAEEFNISFFDSGGTPPTVIFVQGEETALGSKTVLTVPQETVQRIGDTLQSGGARQKRVALIPLPGGAKTEVAKLGEVAERDMGFVNYRKDNTSRMLGAFRMSPIFIARMEDSGRYDAEVQRALTLEQVFDPEQVRYETRLTSLLKDLGFPDMALKLKRLAVENDKTRRDSADKMAEAAVISVREYRDAHGKGPLPEAAEDQDPEKGQYPFGINDRLVNTGKPRGSENRVVEGTGQQGLRPGVAEREQRSTDAEIAAQSPARNGGPTS